MRLRKSPHVSRRSPGRGSSSSELRACLYASFLAWATLLAPARAGGPERPDFRRDILPILSQNCFTCHGPDSKTRKADLRLDLKESALRAQDPVIVPGKSSESELVRRIKSGDPDEVMPPPRSAKKLTGHQIEALASWIDQGAQWSGHWAFEPVRRLPPPTVKDNRWAANPIDRFVMARLDSVGLVPQPPAGRAGLIRRLSLDLIGLPPAPGDVDAFVADRSPLAYEALVDRLLASPQHGERMAMDWLDAARYADTNGFQNDFARTMWPWRDWVITALNHNVSYDQFLIEQLGGDLVKDATLSQRIATGFNRNNRTVTEAGSIDEEYRIENAIDRVETTATVFLGLTLGCARCHDHKFDPVSQTEFYRFLGFFNNVNEQGVYTETRGNVPPLISLPDEQDRRRMAGFDMALAAAQVSGNKEWVAQLEKAKAEYASGIPSVMVMEDSSKPRDLYVLKRGQYDMPDTHTKLTPGPPSCLPPMPPGVPGNRLGLAKWLAAPDQPLTARVAVNRIWQHHFGTGLVKTAENFGVQGEPPSHPELLDWLASELVRSGWDSKALHRLIVTSATYRQASKATPASLARDPENRLLARGPRFRLSAEVVRDNALAIAGLLVNQLGGPSVKPYQPAGLWEELAGGAGEGPYVQDKGPRLYRRSLYVYRKRTVPHPVLATFDAPSRETCQVKLARTNTPLQALELLNDVTYVEAARRLAEMALDDGGSSTEERIVYLFRRALARPPAPQELELLRRGLERYQLAYRADREAAGRLVRHGDSAPSSKLDPAVLAAYTATASVILNLDETITSE
jgi:mono/diheme cytochrome c family protein